MVSDFIVTVVVVSEPVEVEVVVVYSSLIKLDCVVVVVMGPLNVEVIVAEY